MTYAQQLLDEEERKRKQRMAQAAAMAAAAPGQIESGARRDLRANPPRMGEFERGLRQQLSRYQGDQRRRARVSARWAKTGFQPFSSDFWGMQPRDDHWEKVTQKRLAQLEAEKMDAAVKEREDRLLQLSSMPKGRGAREFKRLMEGGSLVETESEKARRQRKKQLELMPNNRGKIEYAKIMEQAKKQEAARDAKLKAGGAMQSARKAATTATVQPSKQVITNPFFEQGTDKQSQADQMKEQMQQALEAQKKAAEEQKQAAEAQKQKMAEMSQKFTGMGAATGGK